MPSQQKDITIAVTSCGRISLLEKTISSLGESVVLQDYEKILTEDSRDEKHIEAIKQQHTSGFLKDWRIIFTGDANVTNPFESHKKALDTLYSNISTPYVFHMEDDWFFRKTEFDPIALSREVLERNPHIGIVSLRDWYALDTYNLLDSKEKLRDKYLTNEVYHYFGFNFIRMKPLSDTSELYILNPGLRRTAQTQEIIHSYSGPIDEHRHGEVYKKLGLFTVTIESGICTHIGGFWKSTAFFKDGFVRSLLRAGKNAIRHYILRKA